MGSGFSFELLNGKVISKDGATVDLATAIKGKGVMLYFAANWCPSCRVFTPVLAEFYTKHHEQKEFEIIYVPGDRDEASFKDYYAKMPWLAVTFTETSTIQSMKKHFKVARIPTLVFLSDDGTVRIANARDNVQDDPDNYPWDK